jgi:hypothetical protein
MKKLITLILITILMLGVFAADRWNYYYIPLVTCTLSADAADTTIVDLFDASINGSADKDIRYYYSADGTPAFDVDNIFFESIASQDNDSVAVGSDLYFADPDSNWMTYKIDLLDSGQVADSMTWDTLPTGGQQRYPGKRYIKIISTGTAANGTSTVYKLWLRTKN